MEDPKYTAF